MKRILCTAATIAALTFACSSTARAQSQALVGPDIGLWVDMAKIDIGLIADFLVTPEVSIQPGLHFIVGIENTTLIVIDGNAHYNFALRGQSFSPYVRGGLGVWYASASFGGVSSSNTDLKLNIGGGVTFNTRSSLQPFAGMSVAFIGGSDIKLHAGIKFAI